MQIEGIQMESDGFLQKPLEAFGVHTSLHGESRAESLGLIEV